MWLIWIAPCFLRQALAAASGSAMTGLNPASLGIAPTIAASSSPACSLHVGEVEKRRIALERLRDGVTAHQRFQLHRAPGTRRVLRNSPSDSPRKAATISGFETPFVRASFSRQKKLAP